MTALLAQKNERITRDHLRALPTPASRGRFHRPVRHLDLIEAIETRLNRDGVEIGHEELALSGDGKKLFGVLDLRDKQRETCTECEADYNGPLTDGSKSTGHGLTLGFRSANDQAFAIQIVVGLRVFVCSNLCFSGDFIALSRKHTTGLRLRDEVEAGLGRYWVQSEHLQAQIKRLRYTPITSTYAREIIYSAVVGGVVPARSLKPIHEAYFRPNERWTDCKPDTLYGLHNAFTRSLAGESTRQQLTHSTAIGAHFRLASCSPSESESGV